MKPIFISALACSFDPAPGKSDGTPPHQLFPEAFRNLQAIAGTTALTWNHRDTIPTAELALWTSCVGLHFEACISPGPVAMALADRIRDNTLRGTSLNLTYDHSNARTTAGGLVEIRQVLELADVSLLDTPGLKWCNRIGVSDRPTAPAHAFRQQRLEDVRPVSRRPSPTGRRAAVSPLAALAGRPLPRGVVAAQQLRQAAAQGQGAVVFGRAISAESVQQLLRGGPTAIMG